MIRRNSDDICIFKNKQKLMLNLLTKNSKLNDSIIRQNTTENVNNLTNISYSEESASYFNNTLNMIDNDNNSNIFQNDISISRKDSDFNIANSEISKFDSVDGTRDDSQKYFLSSSNNNSFQLEYKRDNKKLNQKPSLFFNNSSEFKKEGNSNEKKSTLCSIYNYKFCCICSRCSRRFSMEGW